MSGAARSVRVLLRGTGRAAALCGLLLTAAAMPALAKPQRIASIFLCTDQLLLQLADRSRIVSLNRFAKDPALSNKVGEAKGIPSNRGLAEEILPLKPDLVLAGTYTAPATKAMLRRLGIPVLELPVETDFDGIRANIRRVATALGEEARGETLVAGFDRDLAAIAPERNAWHPSLVLYRFGGYSQGRNTLSQAIFERAGFTNYAATRVDGVGRLSLERIAIDPPDALLLSESGADRNSLSAETLAHPALRRLRATVPTLMMPDRLWICGLADSIEAVRRLAAFRAHAFGPAANRAGTVR
jgi:iron complex transport system substrate-binding protein